MSNSAKACTDPVVGAILSGWRYDISNISPEMRTDYESHLTECFGCRRRQRIARTIDVLLISITSLSIVAFLLAAMVLAPDRVVPGYSRGAHAPAPDACDNLTLGRRGCGADHLGHHVGAGRGGDTGSRLPERCGAAEAAQRSASAVRTPRRLVLCPQANRAFLARQLRGMSRRRDLAGTRAPERSEWDPRSAPGTYFLLGINVLVFLWMTLHGVSLKSPTSAQLLHYGANSPGLVLQGQWYRLVTATFVHIGILHIATNMWCLFLEPRVAGGAAAGAFRHGRRLPADRDCGKPGLGGVGCGICALGRGAWRGGRCGSLGRGLRDRRYPDRSAVQSQTADSVERVEASADVGDAVCGDQPADRRVDHCARRWEAMSVSTIPRILGDFCADWPWARG